MSRRIRTLETIPQELNDEEDEKAYSRSSIHETSEKESFIAHNDPENNSGGETSFDIDAQGLQVQLAVERLRRIPGFETYSYHESDSDSPFELHNDVDNLNLNLEHTEAPEIPARIQADLPESVFVSARDHLRRMTRSRATILPLVLRVDQTNRKVEIARRSLQEQLETFEKLVEDDLLYSKTSRIRMQIALAQLKQGSVEMQAEEKLLANYLEQLFQAQYILKEQEETFYAAVGGDSKLGDSDAEEEDRLLERMAHGSRYGSSVEASLRMTSASQHSTYANPLHEFRVLQESGLTSTNHLITPSALQAGANREIADEIIGTLPERRQSRRHSSKLDWEHPNASSRPTLSFVGGWNMCEELEIEDATITWNHLKSMESKSDAHALSMLTSNFNWIKKDRQRDLDIVFGHDIIHFDLESVMVEKNAVLPRHQSAPKFTDVRVPSMHIVQYIGMWGRNMAQNASLEAYRTYQFGESRLKFIVNQRSQNGHTMLMEDVRKLRVPLSADSSVKAPFITVDHKWQQSDERGDLTSLEAVDGRTIQTQLASLANSQVEARIET